jgi:putative polyhydroxyalkanoate system protein
MSREEVKKLAEKVGDKLEKEYGVCFSWSDYDADIKGPGVSGACNVGEGEIGIKLKLGFLASAFKEKIEEEVKRYLDKLA